MVDVLCGNRSFSFKNGRHRSNRFWFDAQVFKSAVIAWYIVDVPCGNQSLTFVKFLTVSNGRSLREGSITKERQMCGGSLYFFLALRKNFGRSVISFAPLCFVRLATTILIF